MAPRFTAPVPLTADTAADPLRIEELAGLDAAYWLLLAGDPGNACVRLVRGDIDRIRRSVARGLARAR